MGDWERVELGEQKVIDWLNDLKWVVGLNIFI